MVLTVFDEMDQCRCCCASDKEACKKNQHLEKSTPMKIMSMLADGQTASASRELWSKNNVTMKMMSLSSTAGRVDIACCCFRLKEYAIQK